MKKLEIALVPGDGIGPEAIESSRKVLEACQKAFGTFTLAFSEFPAGEKEFLARGNALPELTLDGMRKCGLALVGAINASPKYASVVGILRKKLDLYADLRPAKSFPGIGIPGREIDVICVRENTQGFLADRNLFKGDGEFMPDKDTVISLRVLTRHSCERIAEFAFSTAARLGRKKVTVVNKSIALPMGCGFFKDIARSVAAKYPGIECRYEYVDDVSNGLVTDPSRYDVLLSTNLFGDIVSDVAAAMAENLAPAANLGSGIAVYFPVHHEGKDELAGKDVFNPLAHILCAAMLLDGQGLEKEGTAIRKAVENFLLDKKDKAAAMGTRAMTAGICELLAKS
jgi:3-isopropylmalate dehydrogenase